MPLSKATSTMLDFIQNQLAASSTATHDGMWRSVDPLTMMKERHLVTVGVPRGTGKTHAVAHLALWHDFDNAQPIIVTPVPRQMEMVHTEIARANPKGLQDPSLQLDIVTLLATPQVHLGNISIVLVDEWGGLRESEQDALLLKFAKIAEKKKDFLVVGFYSGRAHS